MQETWTVLMKKADFYGIASRFGIDPVIARILHNRGISTDEEIRSFLFGSLADLNDPLLLLGMREAAELLLAGIEEKKRIRVIGDYDIDGVMSTYILRRGLSELGADVDFRIPDRIRDGYGLNDRLIREAADDGIDILVTCDNGISAGAQTALAHTLGMQVVVTDHHEVFSLPEADAVVDPKQEGDTYPCKQLCGAAVAWKLILAMGGDPEYDLLQYAAFATIGDVVDLTGENRILVKEGLARLRKTKNAGILALCRCCGIRPEQIDTYHIGYVLGPCFNASGRLDSASRAERLLECASAEEAREIAQELAELNASRRQMTDNGVREAEELIDREHMASDPVYVIYLPDVHESIAGIIAGRIRESRNHPVFVLTKGEQGLKGSGRSIPSYSMFEKLAEHAALLTKFGGHPMAAGLSLPEENLPAFRKAINENSGLTEEDFIYRVRIDVPMPVSYVTEKLIGELELLAPFGKENEKPVFAEKEVLFTGAKLIGSSRNVFRAEAASLLPDGTYSRGVTAVCFRNGEALYERIRRDPHVSVVYYPSINEYNGRRSIQIVVTRFR